MSDTDTSTESFSQGTSTGNEESGSYVDKDGSIHLSPSDAGLQESASSSPSPTDEILNLLDGVQETDSEQWEAHCPAHDDDTSLLSVGVGEGGCVLLECAAGCGQDDILRELELKHQDLFPDDIDASWAPEDGTEVARHTYRDANGSPLYDVVQYRMQDPRHPAYSETKSVQQAYLPGHDEAGGDGCPDGYVWGREKHGVDPVLYRRPDVLEAANSGGIVFIVGSEKEVNMLEEQGLEEQGLVATTTPDKTGEWQSSYSEALSGTGVVVLPDNTPAGKVHAHAIAEELCTESRIKIVDLPGLSPEEDVTDWLSGERTIGDLKEEAQKGPAFAPMGMSDASEDSSSGPPIFWYVDDGTVKISRTALTQFLRNRGFGKVYAESHLSSTLVKVEGQVIRRTSTERIKDHVMDYLRNEVSNEDGLPLQNGAYDDEKSILDVIEALMKGASVYFSSSLYKFLPPLDLEPHRADADTAHFYFENGFVEVTAGGCELRPYADLDGLIWEDQIIGRTFTDLSGCDLSGSDWARHLRNVAGHEEQRHDAIRSALGYLQHGYKDPATTKAIIFMDETDSGGEDGRTGKSLTAKGLQETRSVKRMDGRNFSFGRFSFQGVRLDTDIVDFNDVKEQFRFEKLFSAITDDLQVEQKNEDQITIPFEDSPKFLLSTNYVIDGRGDSFEDRTFQVEFSDYYGPDYTPKDEFGRRFFDEWDREAWARFDNIMIQCVRYYLQHGLVDYERVNVDQKRLKQQTSPRFADWVVDFIKPNRTYEKDTVWEAFQQAHPTAYEDLARSTFWEWVSAFARVYGFEKDETRPRRDGDRVRCIEFVEQD